MTPDIYEDKVIQLCSDYAAVAHKNQFRKDKKTPYISHPGRVAGVAGSLGNLDFRGVCAAWLHDTPEDCAVGHTNDKGYPFIIQNHTDRYKDIRLFLLDNPDINIVDGKRILMLTMELCMSQDKSIPKQIRKESYLNNIAKGSIDASIIKYCDRIDNMTTVQNFSQEGFKWYIVDTQILIDKLSPKVKAVNYLICLHLENKLKEVKLLYKKIYGK